MMQAEIDTISFLHKLCPGLDSVSVLPFRRNDPGSRPGGGICPVACSNKI